MQPFNHSSTQQLSRKPLMPGAGFSDHLKHYSLAWALVASVALHAILAGFLHPFKSDTPVQKPPLTVELVQPEPEPPAEVIAPPQPPEPEPEPPKPEPKPEPPVKRPEPPKPIEKPAPAKVPDTPPPPAEPRPEPPAPPVITAAPKPEAPPPAVTAPPPPPPEPPKPVGPTEADIESARQAYGNSLSREIGKHKRYPRIAQMRGWEGTVSLLLEIDANGKVVSINIEEASDREVFNTEAQEMVKRMVQPPPIPDALRGRSFTVRVPISFRLE
jgi:protein TonB